MLNSTMLFCRMISFLLLFSIVGCVYLPVPSPIEEGPPLKEISIETSDDGKVVFLSISHGIAIPTDTINKLLIHPLENIPFRDYFIEITDDSLKDALTRELKKKIEEETFSLYSFHEVRSTQTSIAITLKEDLSRITLMALELKKPYTVLDEEIVISSLIPDDFSYLSDLSFLLPCPNIPIPKQANLLPNAPRVYRNGTHRGIDFPAVYGSKVRSPADGIVIRADHDYREVTNEFRESLLEKASVVGHTPSDVFEHILLGRSVFIDHGIDLVPGKRFVSVHAHLSLIDETIQVGKRVVRGQQLGLCGNSGTSDGALGTEAGAHLHYELIIQDESGERYLGEGLPYTELLDLLTTVFVQE